MIIKLLIYTGTVNEIPIKYVEIKNSIYYTLAVLWFLKLFLHNSL